FSQRCIEASGEALEPNPGRRAGPTTVHIHMKIFTGHGGGKAPALQHIRKILAAQTPLVPTAAGPWRAFPAACALQHHALEAQIQTVECDAISGRTHLERPAAYQIITLEQLDD